MLALVACLDLLLAQAVRQYTIDGRLQFEEANSKLRRPAVVLLQSQDHTYSRMTYAERSGRFKFKKVPVGQYVISASIPGPLICRLSVIVSPGLANEKGNIVLVCPLTRPTSQETQRRAAVSVQSLQANVHGSLESRALWQQAIQEELRGRTDQTKKLLEKAIQLSPAFSDALNMLGTIFHREGAFNRSIQLFERAITANTGYFEPQVNLGGSLLAAGRFEEAERENLRALEMRPEDALANVQMGITLFYRKEHERAIPYLRKAAELDPFAPTQAQLYLCDALALTGKKQEAVAALEDYIRRHPDSPEVARLKERIKELLR